MTTTTMGSAPADQRKVLRGALWTVQLLLAAAFGMAGFTKLATPIDALVAMMPWAADMPELLVRFIGLSEILGAVGLVLPAATRIQPRLTPLAAAGLVTVMVLASLLHASRGEWGALPVNAVLGSLAAFVAWGRHKAAPITAR